nr:MAG TPA: hypothetical protein [Caudoviricetes sp.]DAR10368.1 MAG TPA: hypothetical protein [Caudoviricetes sp.]
MNTKYTFKVYNVYQFITLKTLYSINICMIDT